MCLPFCAFALLPSDTLMCLPSCCRTLLLPLRPTGFLKLFLVRRLISLFHSHLKLVSLIPINCMTILLLHTRTRLLRHLKHSKGNDPCAYYIATHFTHEDEATVARAEQQERSRTLAAAKSGFRAHFASLPAVQPAGPLPKLHCRSRHLMHLPKRPAFRRPLLVPSWMRAMMMMTSLLRTCLLDARLAVCGCPSPR